MCGPLLETKDKITKIRHYISIRTTQTDKSYEGKDAKKLKHLKGSL